MIILLRSNKKDDFFKNKDEYLYEVISNSYYFYLVSVIFLHFHTKYL